jgi:meso-butanediol dehydrogenase/(S,S)-butanediol dehydrogenase/diacetyl reductase
MATRLAEGRAFGVYDHISAVHCRSTSPVPENKGHLPEGSMPSTPTLDLGGTRVWLTGGARGLGRGIAQALADWGARVAVADIDGGGAAETAGLIQDAGGQAWAGEVEVTDETSVETALSTAVDVMGGVDLAVCNAGILTVAPVVDMALADWRRVLEVNATGVFLSARAAARHMIAAGIPGSIVSVASVGGKRGNPQLAHYNASKFAVVGFTQSLAKELGRHGITVNAVCPGVVDTDMIAKLGEGWNISMDEMIGGQVIRRPQSPREIALAIAHLHLNRAITGQAVNVDGGMVFH